MANVGLKHAGRSENVIQTDMEATASLERGASNKQLSLLLQQPRWVTTPLLPALSTDLVLGRGKKHWIFLYVSSCSPSFLSASLFPSGENTCLSPLLSWHLLISISLLPLTFFFLLCIPYKALPWISYSLFLVAIAPHLTLYKSPY